MNKIITSVTLIFVALVYLMFFQSHLSEDKSGASHVESFGYNSEKKDQNSSQVLGEPENLESTQIKEALALESMIELISIQVRPSSTLQRLILELKHRGLQPEVRKDSNPHTGTMHVVRTENSLPGTRYFHAQYFSDKKTRAFMQHMSFEFRPGKGAKKQVVGMINKKFPNLGKAETVTNSYIAWRVNKDYIFWVKEMEAEDLTSDEYNAYTDADIGTIRVGMEWDVHADNHQAAN